MAVKPTDSVTEQPGEHWVNLSTLVVDKNLQPRTRGLDPAQVKSLVESGGSWPALVVVEKDCQTVLVDGFHRLAAARRLEQEKVLVRFVERPQDGDLRALAFALNASHGRPLSLSDRRSEAARLLRLAPVTADREIARRCGLSQPTVAKIRASLETTAQIEHTEIRVGRGGYQHKTDRGQKSRPGSDPEAQRRRVVAYLLRLTDMLYRQDQFPAWTSCSAVAQAVRDFCDPDEALGIAILLGANVPDLYDLAVQLGYHPGSK